MPPPRIYLSTFPLISVVTSDRYCSRPFVAQQNQNSIKLLHATDAKQKSQRTIQHDFSICTSYQTLSRDRTRLAVAKHFMLTIHMRKFRSLPIHTRQIHCWYQHPELQHLSGACSGSTSIVYKHRDIKHTWCTPSLIWPSLTVHIISGTKDMRHRMHHHADCIPQCPPLKLKRTIPARTSPC